MSYLLHPPLLDETGLTEALRWYIQGLTERSGLEITLEISDDFERLSREMELVMFRLVQECLTNIHRHSGSASAVIRIARDIDSVSLGVQDRGKGISAEKLSHLQSQGPALKSEDGGYYFGDDDQSRCQGLKVASAPLPACQPRRQACTRHKCCSAGLGACVVTSLSIEGPSQRL
jgi:hypothetical protein